ncbi:unnamed protein product [Ciceribacter sp. T2.26MG-112.2]|nr:unnamed protein product [Ciceribacter naphthalenivorans]
MEFYRPPVGHGVIKVAFDLSPNLSLGLMVQRSIDRTARR